MCTHCLVTSVRSNKISSLVQSLIEMKAASSATKQTTDTQLDIDVLMLATSQHYERTLLTPSQPNVGYLCRALLSSSPSFPGPASLPYRLFYHAPRLLPMAIMYIHALGFPPMEISLRRVEISDIFSTRYAMRLVSSKLAQSKYDCHWSSRGAW